MTSLINNFQNLKPKFKNYIKEVNLNQNKIDFEKDQSMKINCNFLNNKKDNNNSPNKNEENNKIFHPLEFYGLGKVNNYRKIRSFITSNNGFRSTSNNLLKRNYFSINNRNFDELKNTIPKLQSTIDQQNISENNYLTPTDTFNLVYKYNLPSNVVNQETYNIAKEKLFSKDIFSSIKKGKLLSRNDFLSQKRNLIRINEKKFLTPKNKSINYETSKYIKKNNSSINIRDKSSDINNYKEKKNLEHSSSTILFNPKNPKDLTEQKLINTVTHFDKNYSEIVRDRNWWKAKK